MKEREQKTRWPRSDRRNDGKQGRGGRRKSAVKELYGVWVATCKRVYPEHLEMCEWEGRDWGQAKHLAKYRPMDQLIRCVVVMLEDWSHFCERYPIGEELPRIGHLQGFADSWFPEIEADHHRGLLRKDEYSLFQNAYREVCAEKFPDHPRLYEPRWDLKLNGKLWKLHQDWGEEFPAVMVKLVLRRWPEFRKKFGIIKALPTPEVVVGFANSWCQELERIYEEHKANERFRQSSDGRVEEQGFAP